MGQIGGTVLFVLGVVGAILIPVIARVLGDDVKEWLPWVTKCLVDRAVSRLPEKQRDRFKEEWWAHINELPGNLAKVYAAWGYLSASKAMNRIAISGDTTRIEETIRRAIELAISVSVLVITFPLLIAISLCIKLDSRGPVLVKFTRLGPDNLPFDLLKFRSTYTSGKGPRVTRVGRLIRTTSLDELPQLLNVLRGEKSLVRLIPDGQIPAQTLCSPGAVWLSRQLQKIPIPEGRELPSVGVIAVKLCACSIGVVLAVLAIVLMIAFAFAFAYMIGLPVPPSG